MVVKTGSLPDTILQKALRALSFDYSTYVSLLIHLLLKQPTERDQIQYSALKESGSESIENAKEVVRTAAHTDFGALTLLFQRPSQPGLEIKTPSSTWAPVAVYPPGTEGDAVPPIVVNIGDLLSYWTAGVLKSTMHRVCIPNKNREDRYSIAFFCHPVATTELNPIPSPFVSASENVAMKPGENGKAQVLTAAEHLRKRLAAVYGWDT